METKFEDSNIALLGSDFEKALRKERAEAEPEWQKAGLKVGLQIWRIEKFNVKPWPLEEYGNFFTGDTYIVLNTKKKEGSDALEYNAHMWVGKETSIDEAGTAAYKIVELDDHFNGAATLIYEPQDYESEIFRSYFKIITIMAGGIESGFKKVPIEEYKPHLIHVTGNGSCVHGSEVPLHFKSLNGADVFILDAGKTIFNWRGKNSSGYEKYHGTMLCNKIKNDRLNSGCKVEIVECEQGDKNPEFIKYLKEGSDGDIQAKRQEIEAIKKGAVKKMVKVSDESGEIKLDDVAYDKASLNSSDAFIIDRGDAILIWVGKSASKNEKRFSIVYGQKYLKSTNRPACLPIITVQEGMLEKEIEKCFN